MSRFALALLPVALALAACGEEPQAPEIDTAAIDMSDDALATDTSVLPPQDTSGQSEPGVGEPVAEPGPIMTTPVEPNPGPTPGPAAT